MSKTMYVATHHPMSVEDPESGSPPEIYGVSEDRDVLAGRIMAEMNAVTATMGGVTEPAWGEVRVVAEDDILLIKASFPGQDALMTYYVIEPAPLF